MPVDVVRYLEHGRRGGPIELVGPIRMNRRYGLSVRRFCPFLDLHARQKREQQSANCDDQGH